MNKKFFTLAHLAVQWQCGWPFLADTLSKCGVPTAFELNGVAYIAADVAELFRELIGELKNPASEEGNKAVASLVAKMRELSAGDVPPMIRATAAPVDLILPGGAVELTAAADKPAKVSMLAYSGQIINAGGLGPVAFDTAGLEMRASIPILADHQNDTDSVVGSLSAEARGGKIYAAGVLARGNPKADRIVADSVGGIQWQCSVGVEPVEIREIAAGQAVTVNGATLKLDRAWRLVANGRLREISIVAIGSDPTTNVQIQAKGQTQMTKNVNTVAPAVITASAGTTDDTAPEILAERTRLAAIAKAVAKHRPDNSGDIIAKATAENWTPDKAELEAMRASRTAPAFVSGRRAPGVSDGAMLTAALLCKFGREAVAVKAFGADALECSRPLHRANLMDMVKAALQFDHIECNGGKEEMIRAAFSSVSLPNALGDTAHRMVETAYAEAPATYTKFASVRPVSDFRAHSAIRTSYGGSLTQVAPTGEIQHGTISEDFVTTFRVDTFGKMLSITRQDIINDDASAFGDMALALGKMGARAVSDLVWSTIMANGGSFYSTAHKNNATGSGSALSATALSAAAQKMSTQRDKAGTDLDIVPKVVVVPPSIADAARSLLQSEWLWGAAAGDATANPNRNRVSLEVEPRLENERFTGNSAATWYLFGSPSDAPVILGYLNGRNTPTVEFFGQDSSPSVLGWTWRTFFDFGVALHEYRAAVRSVGA